MSQLELTLMPSGSKPYQARFCPVLVICKSIESLAVLLIRFATTPGGKIPSEKFAMLPNAAPVYLMSENWPVFRPNAVMLITMPLPGADKVPLALMAGTVGFPLSVP